MNNYIHAIHDPGGEHLFADKPGWIIHTVALSEVKTGDYRPWAGFGNIVRLNWSYFPNGTIPLPPMYSDFAERCAVYVSASPECRYVIIGNEPGHLQEQIPGHPITPSMYADCFNRCYAAIKALVPATKVITAPIAPWDASTKYPSNENGDWIVYFQDMLSNIPHLDGIGLHGYTHGAGIDLITSEKTMDAPFQNRRYEFRAYLDFLNVVPIDKKNLPVYWTETDQTNPWVDANTGWVKAAYTEVNQHNQTLGTQKIHCLALYRWPKADRWSIVDKPGVQTDFHEAVQKGYKVPDQPTTNLKGVVTAVLLNVRDKPDVTGKLVDSRAKDNAVDILETSKDGSWYRIGNSQWVSSAWVKLLDQDDFNKCLAWILRWEGLYSDNPADNGGATMKGITLGTYTAWREAHEQTAPSKDDLKNISDKEVSDIYYNNYWLKSGADRMTWPMNLAHFNISVNAGIARAQQALAVNGTDFWKYMLWCRDWYRSLSNFNVFGNGWINRCKDLVLTAYE